MMTAFNVAGVKMYQSLERISSKSSMSRYIAALPQREWRDFKRANSRQREIKKIKALSRPDGLQYAGNNSYV